ncbi:hypothetical protein IRJ41_007875 [Triplophysa rosa]|uniref:DDE Tnp4 domain-containing protein n=1 Tax=Triplophysa rosa TaxID=992332 RepID=A0A9W8C429_TRIRA|nr:hypothetical protein IRJ41_007875 [Triplophysa rosa]
MESSSSDDDFVVLSLLKKRKIKRKYWVHPVLRLRNEEGEFHLLIMELRDYPDRFKIYFRMSVAQFDALLAILKPHIKKKTTNFREPIDPEQRLAVCVYLSTGDSFTTIASSFRLGISTVGMIVRETSDQIWLQLKDTYMPTPTEDIWKHTARRFNDRFTFFNYKGTFSIVLLALVDADYRFLAIDVGSYGGNSDGGIFADSALGRALHRGTLNVPAPLELPSAPELGKVNHVIVADEAFPMKPYLLRPYGGKRLQEDKRIFNLRLSRARRISENAFGILTQRFRVYKRPMEVNPDLADNIIKATCILSNYLRHEVVGQVSQVDSFDFDNAGNACLEEFQRPRCNRASEEALHIRDTFRKYFVSAAGEVPWQYNRVRCGHTVIV